MNIHGDDDDDNNGVKYNNEFGDDKDNGNE